MSADEAAAAVERVCGPPTCPAVTRAQARLADAALIEALDQARVTASRLRRVAVALLVLSAGAPCPECGHRQHSGGCILRRLLCAHADRDSGGVCVDCGAEL